MDLMNKHINLEYDKIKIKIKNMIHMTYLFGPVKMQTPLLKTEITQL